MRLVGRRKPEVSSYISLAAVLLIFLRRTATALMCNNCRTYEKDVGCDQECEGDFCVLWKYTEMSIDHRIQGCIKGVDYSRIPMGCQTNKVDATLCLCNTTDFCNSEAVQFPSGGAQPIAQIEVPTTKCQSSTEAPYIPKSAKASQFTQCLSDYCFFTQTNVSPPKSGAK
ncbi:Protein C15C8.5 [Aphelenchoides avenae]|nr:Protein C15C8.5 [Aphelenchus avenae]